MILFWVLAGVLSAAAAGFILQRAAQAASKPEAADPTIGLYRRQLGEIDDLAERGLLGPDERRGARAEAARRMLGAADASAAPWNTQTSFHRIVLAATILAPLLALALYLAGGSPRLPDQPFARRLAAWRAAAPETLTPTEMAAVLTVVTKERPRDPEAQRFLAMAQSASDNPAAAVRALRRAVTLAPNRADLWEALGEASMMQADGEVTPQAVVAFQEALARDAKLPASRFHLARAKIAAGDRAQGLAEWQGLLADLPKADPRRAALEAAIAQAQSDPAPAAPGPEAIRGMVESLAARLQAQPDDAEGWVRLVRSYAVLGEAAKRDEALKAAQVRYAGRPEVLDALKAAAAAEPMR